jgi:hypothetical protein
VPFGKVQSGCHVPFTEEWLPFWPFQHNGLIGGVLQRFSHLHRGTLELCQSDHQVLGHLPDQGPSPPIAQFGRRPALGTVLVFQNIFHLRMMEATVFLSIFNTAEMFWYPAPTQSCLRSLRKNPSTSWLGFSFLHALSTVGPYIDRCVPFQSCQIN